jgi:CMP-N,N'-diacetyllegionaminic acid synthase
LDKVYFPYGVIYISKTEALKKFRSFYQEKTIPYFIERWQNYEIDDIYEQVCIEAINKYRWDHADAQ